MTRQSTQIILDKDLEACRRCLIVHDLDLTVKESDINRIIAKTLDTNTIKFHVKLNETQCIHDRQSQCATVILPNEEMVNKIMKRRPILFHENELSVSRQIPRSYYLCHHITHGLKVEILTKNINCIEDEQIDLKNYFRHYGGITYCEYMDDKKAYFIFDDYDIVDRIILEKNLHRYKGFSLSVEKVRLPNGRRTIVNSDVSQFCIHVTNIPKNVTSEDLSIIFKVNIANILIRPYNESNDHLVEKDRRAVEAWIREISNEQLAKKLATEKSGIDLRGFKIQCEAITTPLNISDLCEHFQKGVCSFSIGCHMKHIRCIEPVNCNNTQCWYGHDAQRMTKSERRPISNEDGYRIRITNFPPNVTRAEIFRRLQVKHTQIKENLILCNEFNSTEPIIAYVIDQKSENIAKQLIHSWHNQLFSTDQKYKMKCQLEINVEYFNSTIGISLPLTPLIRSRTPSIVSSMNSMKMRKSKAVLNLQKWCIQSRNRNNLDQNENDSNVDREQELNEIKLPYPWSWANAELLNERMNEASRVYSIVDRTYSNKKAEIRIYSTMSDRTSRLRVQRHRMVLERLTELDGIPKLIDCNYDILKNNCESSEKLWIITESIEGMSLDTYVSRYVPDFRQTMNIILTLINLVKQIHKQGVVHRNLTPRNILIHCSMSSNDDQFYLELIDFDLAYVTQKNINRNNGNIFYHTDNPVENNFYLIPQFEIEPLNNNDIDDENQKINIERESKEIDTSFICAILFWMITLHEPEESRNIDGKAPHELNEHIQLIKDELRKLTDECSIKFQSLWRHLTLIFDRGFAKPKQQWSIDELEYQIRFIIELITNMKNQDEIFQHSSIAASTAEPFIRLASFIHGIKYQFVTHYSRFDSIHWSQNENNRWSGDNQKTVNYDILTIEKHELPIRFEMSRIEKENKLQICVQIKMNNTTIVELPFGGWQENEIENEFETIVNIFIMEFTNFYNILSE